MSEATTKLRIDKWLWFARVVKTRSLAAKLVTSGGVRLNKERVTAASQAVKIGDVLTIMRGREILVYKVVQLGTRRGPAPEAQLLYEDLSPKPDPTTPKEETETEAGHGRPSKKDRREIMRLKRGFLEE